ncbi:MAG TPA: MEKHLA domain-containing protein [Methyloceanibacter sp.]|nr:MEKHLA domain-containing protein [Methyloceanibacter sp.]
MHRAEDPLFFALLVESYRRITGQQPPFLAPPVLPPDVQPSARWLYADASVCVLAHNTAPDPHFIYANRSAQVLFGYSFDEIAALPSRLSAEEPARGERQRLLDQVTRDGFATGYSGVRIAKSGRRFRIEDGVLWQLKDQNGTLHGVAATFATWRDV